MENAHLMMIEWVCRDTAMMVTETKNLQKYRILRSGKNNEKSFVWL